MAHIGGSNGFFSAFKEAVFAFSFNLGGLLAGFVVVSQLGIFQRAPWVIAVYPAILSAKSIMDGLLSGRLSTALHLGIIYPRFNNNTKNFYKLLEAIVVLTLVTSVVMGMISLGFGYFFWGITFADFPAILSIVVVTLAVGLSLTFLTAKMAFVTFKKGLDPDIIVYPIIAVAIDILITVFYVLLLNVLFFGQGNWIILLVGVAYTIFALYLLSRNVREPEFVKTLKESLVAMLFVALIANITGTFLRAISNIVNGRREVYLIYPALIGLVSGVGSVISSTATTRLALGLLKPSFSSIRNHAKHMISAWLASIILFTILAALSLLLTGNFSSFTVYHYILVVLVANVLAVAVMVSLAYGASILTFKRGLDPDNLVIPIENASAHCFTTIALYVALILLV